MIRFALGLLTLSLCTPALSADLTRPVPAGRFRATCEDLGKLCFADACGRDQIDAALACRAQCPSSSVMSVVPETCLVGPARNTVILDRRG